MKTGPVSRRMFLQGTGGFLLAIPSLTSLLSRAARAQSASASVRYVQWISDHGQYDANFWPSAAPSENAQVGGAAVPGVKIRALSSISGPLSLVLGSDFDSFRAKMNLIGGLDLPVVEHHHNACVPTCGSWPRVDNHIPEFAHSVDSILETSSAVYPSTVVAPVLRLTPGVASSYKWGSFCWTTRDGKPFKLPCYDDTGAALQAVFGSGGATNAAPVVGSTLVDQVLEDYQRVANSSAIGVSDRAQLSNYMDLLADVQRRQSVGATVSCSQPDLAKEEDFNVLHANATDLAVAAMLCGATRVVAYHAYQGSPTSYDEETFHSWAHEDATKHGQMMVWRYKQLARLISTMDSFTEANGKTLLDNSLVYASNELSKPGHGSGHLQNMPIVTAGTANGLISAGNYIDFGGRLLNNLFVTIFNMMGLSPQDYERNGVVGFGDYEGNNLDRYNAYLSDSERRKPLPFLYRG